MLHEIVHATALNGRLYFAGPQTIQVYGSPVPLSPNNFKHYGEEENTSGLAGGHMHEHFFRWAYRQDISPLDLAILADCGLPVRPDQAPWISGAPAAKRTARGTTSRRPECSLLCDHFQAAPIACARNQYRAPAIAQSVCVQHCSVSGTLSKMLKDSDSNKTKPQLIEELQTLRRRLAQSHHKPTGWADEQSFQAIFESANAGMVVADAEGNVLHANPAACRILGYDRGDLQDRNFRDISVEEDLQKEEPLLAEIFAGVRDRYQLTKRCRRNDGGITWGNVSVGAIRDENGNVTGLVGTVVDITDRRKAKQDLRRSEQRFRLLIENMPVLVVEIDRNGRITYWNTASEMLHHDDPSALIFPDNTYRNRLARERQREAARFVNKETTVRAKDGSDRQIMWTSLPVDEDDTIWALGVDITEQKRAEAEVLDSRKCRGTR